MTDAFLPTAAAPSAPAAAPAASADRPRPADRRARPARPQHVLTVLRTERLTEHLVRVHLGGDGFDAFVAGADPARLAATDRYVKLLLAPPGSALEPPHDLDALRARLAPSELPVRRTYTVRSVDLEARSLAIDFVVHGDEGVAGPWAASARPGDRIEASSPGGAWAPRDGAVHLLLGDESALPAIAAALEAMPAAASGLALIEVQGSADELPVPVPVGVELRWLHRGDEEAGVALTAAVRDLPRPEGAVEVFAHGERTAMKRIRAILQDDWGVDRASLSLSAYWALGRAEDRFQAEKREPVGAIFPD